MTEKLWNIQSPFWVQSRLIFEGKYWLWWNFSKQVWVHSVFLKVVAVTKSQGTIGYYYYSEDILRPYFKKGSRPLFVRPNDSHKALKGAKGVLTWLQGPLLMSVKRLKNYLHTNEHKKTLSRRKTSVFGHIVSWLIKMPCTSRLKDFAKKCTSLLLYDLPH